MLFRSKTLARSFAGGAGAPAQAVGGTSAAATTTCSSTSTGSGQFTITCSGGGMEIQMTLNGTNISGYEKLTNFEFSAGGKTNYVNGQIDIGGTITATVLATGQYTSTTSEKFNGKLQVSGGDSFDLEFKDFGITLVVSGSAGGFNVTSACSGKLAVDTVDFTVNADCSIAN